MDRPARLGKGCHPDFLDEEFSISVLQLVFLVFMVVVFFGFCFIAVPQTFGWF